MVRFKNRHILVEVLQSSSLSATFNSTGSTSKSATALQSEEEAQNNPISNDIDDDLDGDTEAIPQPPLPFMLPLPSVDGSKSRLNLGDEGGGVIYRAVRGSVQEVYGDEGWGRIASSFKVIYHSPLTTLTILRVARQHYRLLWSAITFLTTIQGQSVLPRVVAVSGTIKKLQNTAIVYHRQVTGRMMAVVLEHQASITAREKGKQLEKGWENERLQIRALED